MLKRSWLKRGNKRLKWSPLKRGTKQLKRSPLKKLGKKGLAWQSAREELKKEYDLAGITECEIKSKVCFKNKSLGFVHRHKRIWYDEHPGLLGSMNQTLLGCNPCHDVIEHAEELTEQIFLKLRGSE